MQSIPVCLQTDNPLRPNHRVMDNAGWQVKPVSDFHVQLFSKLRQAKGDAPLHNIDDFVVGMRMSRVPVMRAIRP